MFPGTPKKSMPLNDGSSRRILVPLPFFCDNNVIRDLPNINDREDEEHVEKKHLLIFWFFCPLFVFAAFDVLLTIDQRILDRCLASPLLCFVMLCYALVCFVMAPFHLIKTQCQDEFRILSPAGWRSDNFQAKSTF